MLLWAWQHAYEFTAVQNSDCCADMLGHSINWRCTWLLIKTASKGVVFSFLVSTDALLRSPVESHTEGRSSCGNTTCLLGCS